MLVINELKNMPASDRGLYLSDYIKQVFASYLHIDDVSELKSDESFFDQGLTSLGVTEIQYQLENELSCQIDSSLMFNCPTVNDLVESLKTIQLFELFSSDRDVSDLIDAELQLKDAEDERSNHEKAFFNDVDEILETESGESELAKQYLMDELA